MELSTDHIAFCQRYLINGNDVLDAFLQCMPQANKVTRPLTSAKALLKSRSVQLYLINEGQKLLGQYDITREFILRKHLDIIEIYEFIISTLDKDELTEAEENKLMRYKLFGFKPKDYNNALEQVAKLSGFNEVTVNINKKVTTIEVTVGLQPARQEQDLQDYIIPEATHQGKIEQGEQVQGIIYRNDLTQGEKEAQRKETQRKKDNAIQATQALNSGNTQGNINQFFSQE